MEDDAFVVEQRCGWVQDGRCEWYLSLTAACGKARCRVREENTARSA